ncbi:MAG: 4-hydroxythreonine-4-phosphate dehydrogenase PdxA [Treponema sp.]|nr:4-hydroxythreonine-4-phosphate dehydrogenase PdxA [Treponema sp.]
MTAEINKPIVGIILGDPAGIGPEIALKLLMRPSTYYYAEPVLIGNFELLCRTAALIDSALIFKKCGVDDLPELLKAADFKGIPVVDIPGAPGEVTLGRISNESGRIAYSSIVCGYAMLEKKALSSLIMCPINKEALAQSGSGFSSEYELFARLAGVNDVQSVVKGGDILRSTVVGHVPFRRILENLTVENIVQTGIGLHKVFSQIFDQTPNFCIAALNPHGGEGGILGEEENEIIIPAMERIRGKGIEVHGPFPCDTIYAKAINSGYNGIIYLYHDQGNIAMKAKIFETTALIYTNMPYTILSTGHGSALDIAALGIANPTNLCYVMTTLNAILSKKSPE